MQSIAASWAGAGADASVWFGQALAGAIGLPPRGSCFGPGLATAARPRTGQRRPTSARARTRCIWVYRAACHRPVRKTAYPGLTDRKEIPRNGDESPEV